jgi:hypothetical protein
MENFGSDAMLTEIVTDERAWRGDSLRPGSWIVPIP